MTGQEPPKTASPTGDGKPVHGGAMDRVEAFEQLVEHEIEVIKDEVVSIATTPPRTLFLRVVWRELPYIVMLSLALFGIGYVSFSGEPGHYYWITLAPIFGAICVLTGWRAAKAESEHFHLLWTQAAHWAAVVAAMDIVYLPSVRSIANDNAAGLTLMVILALATFLAGIHASAWQICVVGVILSLAVPTLAWIAQSSLFFFLIVIGVLFIGATLWWAFHKEKKGAAA